MSIVSISMRQRILRRDHYRCYYCRVWLYPSQQGAVAPTIDHVVPRSRGGGNDPDNLVAACFSCNQKKGDSLLLACGEGDYPVKSPQGVGGSGD